MLSDGDRKPHFFFSNRVEELFFFLKELLFLPLPNSSPFTKRIVLLPSEAMKRWVLLGLSKELPSHVAMGIDWVLPDQAFLALSAAPKRPIPNALRLSLALEKRIRQHLLKTPSDPIWRPLAEYLEISSLQKGTTPRQERRLCSLVGPLAQAFHEYGIYGQKLVASWEEPTHWQGVLWHELFGPDGPYTFPAEHLATTPLAPGVQEAHVHLFAFSFLAKIHHDFLQRLPASCLVSYYLLSPCKMFWTDSCSDKERRRLERWWERQGAHADERRALEDYLKDTNPLLANLGKVGREFLGEVEETEGLMIDGYASAQEGTKAPLLLRHLQEDLLTLHNPALSLPKELSCHDDSLQIHAAPSKRREVEALYNALLRLIAHDETRCPLSPRDIVVMAPNIADYEPYIRAVFEGHNSLLGCQFTDLALAQPGSTLQGLESLLSLAKSRWDPLSFLALVTHPAFAKKQRFLPRDLETLRRWIEQGKVRWGLSKQHKDQLISGHPLFARGKLLAQKATAGTWQEGVEQWLLAMTRLDEDDEMLASLDFSDSELFSRLLALLASLSEDLKPFSDGTRLPLHLWAEYLLALLDSYFEIDPLQRPEEHLHQKLLAFLQDLRQADGLDTTESWPFSSIFARLEAFFEMKEGTYRDRHLDSVRFSSMLPMRAVPSRVLCLLGMDEDSYPRRASLRSFNLLSGPLADYCPSRADFDRYLFLEALLSARDHLLLFYPNIDTTDYKEKKPSSIVDQLLRYLDAGYRIEGRLPSETLVVNHPFSPFASTLFSKDDSWQRSYDLGRYQDACCLQQGDKKTLPSLVAIHTPPAVTPPADITLSIQDLAQAVKDPVHLFLEHTLSLRLKKPQEIASIEEDFVLTPLDLWKIRRDAGRQEEQALLQKWENKRRFGEDSFSLLAKQHLAEETHLVQHHLASWGIQPGHIFSIELSSHCRTPQEVLPGRWVYPEIVCPLGPVHVRIKGALANLCHEGLIAPYTGEKSHHLFRLWPSHLVLAALTQEFSHLGSSLLFPSSGVRKSSFVQDPIMKLGDYLTYYLAARTSCSFLTERSLKSFLQDRTNMNFLSEETMSPGMLWLQRRQKLPSPEEVRKCWEPLALSAFHDLYEAWLASSRSRR